MDIKRKLERSHQFKIDMRHVVSSQPRLEKVKTIVSKLAHMEPSVISRIRGGFSGQWPKSKAIAFDGDWLIIFTFGEGFLRLERVGLHLNIFDMSHSNS